MRLSTSLLLPAFVGAAQAASEPANVYIMSFSGHGSSSSTPKLTPEEARLVLAQRIEVSQYHNLQHASDDTLSYINNFGGEQKSLFTNYAENKPLQLVVVAEGWTQDLDQSLASSWSSIKPSFDIISPPSESANKKLVQDMLSQSSYGTPIRDCPFEEAVNPFISDCWAGPNKIIHLDVQSNNMFLKSMDTIREAVANEIMEMTLVAMPQSNRKSKHSFKSYGSYDMPKSSYPLRRQVEEPINGLPHSSPPQVASKPGHSPVFQAAPLVRVSLCHQSLEACSTATNNCSSHGSCFLKYGSTEEQNACFTCGCQKTQVSGKNGGTVTTYWGGTACQKQDVSAQFWLLASFSIVMVGVLGWAIGMMFSIGEEKLPGVIGAGVSGPKAR